ncbi:MAG: polysaccharide deacetylase family protein, partial [Acholeplasmataceae bacterium]|nr:polysaccharide deacetylase family protein [Acholeplasmataceae bacterium]
MTSTETILVILGVIMMSHIIHFVIFMLNFQPILMYHRVDDRLRPEELRYINHKNKKLDLDQMKIRPKDFKRQMDYLKHHGYQTVSKPLGNRKNVIITFDDGYEDNYRNAFPVLKEYGFMAIFFVTTDYISNHKLMEVDKGDDLSFNKMMTYDQLKEMLTSNMVIGSHTQSHIWLTSLDEETQKNELVLSKRILEDQLHTTINTFAYPAGMYDN